LTLCLQDGVALPSKTEALIEACDFLGENEKRSSRFWKNLSSSADPAEVTEQISPKQGEEQWDSRLLHTFDVLLNSGFRARWSEFADNAITAMSVPDDSLPSETVLAIVSKLQRLAQVHRKKLEEFAQAGLLHHHYHRAVARELSTEAAGILLAIIEVRNPVEDPTAAGESQAGHQHVQQMLTDARSQEEFPAAIFESLCSQINLANREY